MRRVLPGLLALVVVLGSALPAAGDQKADAKAKLKAIQADLDAATRELAATEEQAALASREVAGLQRRLTGARAELAAAQRALGDQAAALYASGGADLLSALLGSGPGGIAERAEFVTVVVDRQRAATDSARVAAASYQQVLRQISGAKRQAARLEGQLAEQVDGLQAQLDKAQRLVDKLEGFGRRVSIGGRYIACPVSPPYSYADTWGAARSGGRAHKGTDIMNPYGNKVHAYVNGVVSRLSTSALGGISLYLRGDDGNEYYYAHLSRYASRAGQRVQAGELVAYNGNTGNARYTGPHVHFEVHPGAGAPVNPYPYVRRACG